MTTALNALFSTDQLIAEPAALARWSATTHPVSDLPRLVVVPRDRAQVIAAVKAIAGSGLSVSAIGRGMNVGLGGRIGPTSADIVLDLSQNRQILHYDAAFGVIDVEAGVSFRQAHEFLRAQRSRFFVPSIGGPADASLVGNLLQRGDGCGPGGDRVSALIELEAVTASGEVVTVGRGVEDRPGPDLSGLFLQSRAGIVTRAKLALTPLPLGLVEFTLRVNDGAPLAPVLAAMREAHLRNILAPGAVSLWNGAKVAAKNDAPYKPDAWFLSGALHVASRARAEADWADLLACLQIAAVTVMGCRLQHPTDGLGAFQGEPLEEAMAAIRSGLADPNDPDADPGFVWLCPTIPFNESAVDALAIIRAAGERAKLTPHVAMTSQSARTLRAFVSIAWDRADKDAEKRALQCHADLLDQLARAGFPPFRLGHLSRAWRPTFADQTDLVTGRLLAALASPQAVRKLGG